MGLVAWVAVVETNAYRAQARHCMTEEERDQAVQMVAREPECGAVMTGTGGIRKVRMATANRGKSGGARVVYYYRDDDMPIFMLAAFGKNEKPNLTKAERNALARLVDVLVSTYGV